jgi:hypothetical protein
VLGIDRYLVYTGYLTALSYIGTLFKIQFVQDSDLLRVQFRHDSLLKLQVTNSFKTDVIKGKVNIHKISAKFIALKLMRS